MHYWFVCGENGKGAFRFPQNGDKLSLWLKSLGIWEILPKKPKYAPDIFMGVKFWWQRMGTELLRRGPYHQSIFGGRLPHLSIAIHQIQGMRRKFNFLGSWFSLLCLDSISSLTTSFMHPMKHLPHLQVKHTMKVNTKLGEKGQGQYV